MGACWNPGQSRIPPTHIAFPALHGNNCQFAPHLVIIIHPKSHFARSEAVQVSHRRPANKSLEAAFENIAAHKFTAHRIRTIEDNELFVVFDSGFHAQLHCAHIGIGSIADVLDVVHKDIDITECRRAGFVEGPLF